MILTDKTIEEVAENFCRNDETMSDYVQGAYITDFIQGAKWMQEQDRENLQVTNQQRLSVIRLSQKPG